MVRILPADCGEKIAVKDASNWLFSSITGDRGHEPFGKVEIPSPGSYRIQVTHDDARVFDSAAAPGPSR
jgi:hypothetical protein